MSSSSSSSNYIGYYHISNPNHFISTGDADNRYIRNGPNSNIYLYNSNNSLVLSSASSGNTLHSPNGQNTLAVTNNNIKLLKPLESTEYGKFDYLSYTRIQSGLLDAPLNQTIVYTLKSGNNLQIMVGFNNNGIQYRAAIQLVSGSKNREDLGLVNQSNNWTS